MLIHAQHNVWTTFLLLLLQGVFSSWINKSPVSTLPDEIDHVVAGCQEDNLFLQCRNRYNKLVIKDTFYGRDNTFTCASKVLDTSKLCNEATPELVVQKVHLMCGGENKCKIPVTQDFLEKKGEEICPDVRKYLKIKYACHQNPHLHMVCHDGCSSNCWPSCEQSCCNPSVPTPNVVVSTCGNGCPSQCAPLCQPTCCQAQSPTIMQYQPSPTSMCQTGCSNQCVPLCQPSCCLSHMKPSPTSTNSNLFQQPPPRPQYQSNHQMQSTCLNGCASQCAPLCDPACCQSQNFAATVHYQPPPPPPPPMCPAPCSAQCAPLCQPSCCQTYAIPQSSMLYVPPSPPAVQLLSPASSALSTTACPTGCPSQCAPLCQPTCCQSKIQALARIPSQPSCGTGCPNQCAPLCQPTCCQASSHVNSPRIAQPMSPPVMQPMSPPGMQPMLQPVLIQPQSIHMSMPSSVPYQQVAGCPTACLAACPSGCPRRCCITHSITEDHEAGGFTRDIQQRRTYQQMLARFRTKQLQRYFQGR